MHVSPHLLTLSRAARSARYGISALVAVVLVPALLAGWWFADRSADDQRALIDRHAEQAARSITALIEQKIRIARSVVVSMANSRSIVLGDFEHFDMRAKEIAHQLDMQIVLVDPHLKQQITNSAVPWGTPLPRGLAFISEAIDQEMSRRPGPVVSNVFFAPAAKQHVTAVTLPVIRDGKIGYFLSLGIPTKKIAEILDNALLPEHWAVSIVDRNNTIVARSEKHDEFTGTKIRNTFLKPEMTFGRQSGVNREGVTYQWTYLRSDQTGWFITIGVPEAVLAASRKNAATLYLISAAILLSAGFGAAYYVGGRIESRQAERQQEQLRRRLMQAQEDERLRLARELHDETGQGLTAVMLQIKNMEKAVDESRRSQFRQLRMHLDQMGKSLHRVAADLRPASIDEMGLANSLSNYLADWKLRAGIGADFHCSDDDIDKHPDEIKTAIFRIFQEALTNVAKHARGATMVGVVLSRTPTMLRLTIVDDGCGFEPSARPDEGGKRRLGLAGIRERLRLLGSDLEIESAPGQGTSLFARIPLAPTRMVA